MIAILGLACLVWAGILAIYANRALKCNKLELTPRMQLPRLAVLIPARDESAVIEGLLKSITKQTLTINLQDVYVIVESSDDPTVQICAKYGCQVIVRQHPERQRKGYALDEAVKQILRNDHYDLYFIFDADNRLAPTYFTEMLKTYAAGYRMATGYRNAKNNNYNVITAVSALTFTMINTMGNQNRIKKHGNIIFSGTGCFVDGALVEKWHGWPFHSLTEDYEMSLYAVLHNIPTYYNTKAVFYDEQPTRYKQTVDQRVRWIKGYFSARKEYIPQMRKCGAQDNRGSVIKELVGVRPIIWALIGVIFLLFDEVVKMFVAPNWPLIISIVAGLLVIIYVILLIITVVMIKLEKMHFNPKIKLQAILYNPIYLLSYVPCALKALFTRNVTWKKIEHGSK